MLFTFALGYKNFLFSLKLTAQGVKSRNVRSKTSHIRMTDQAKDTTVQRIFPSIPFIFVLFEIISLFQLYVSCNRNTLRFSEQLRARHHARVFEFTRELQNVTKQTK